MNQKEVGFTIDAGLIQRLGYELVGKAETAVSELIKNAYDADARNVNVYFKYSDAVGGSLIISDDGLGMTEEQLVNGFMRISSSEKIHHPISPRYGRCRAGRKGIGRFATQRLGEQLVITTQTLQNDTALKISIDWNAYKSDTDLSSIHFPIEEVPKMRKEGTTLEINGLRDTWSVGAIKRVYRYAIDLFKPNYLGDTSYNSDSFKSTFYKLNDDGVYEPIFTENNFIFDKALVTLKGYIDEESKGYVKVLSESLGLNDLLEIGNFKGLLDVHFTIYYFIYNRSQYYGGKITGQELKKIQDLADHISGVRLYRNGFRVLPYGEPTDDWTQIDRRWSSDSGVINVPLNNKNLFGFVEVKDPSGILFEETASREGLIENTAFLELTKFLNGSLVAARQRIAAAITRFKTKKNPDITEEDHDSGSSMEEKLNVLDNLLDDKIEDGNDEKKKTGKRIVEDIRNQLEELSMLRVLAGLGLSIGEFTHEIKQYRPAIYSHIHNLTVIDLPNNAIQEVDGLKNKFDDLFVYTNFFNITVSQNINRNLEPIDILEVIDLFKSIIDKDLEQSKIDFILDPWDYDVETIPMHRSEWNSILYNLYSNAKKAIIRAKVKGKILVEVGNLNEDTVYINFQDNGDGVPEENRDRIFDAFFTTSLPASFTAPRDEQMIGTGLGLKILKDIIVSYKGKIYLSNPNDGYSTCFKIELPKYKKI